MLSEVRVLQLWLPHVKRWMDVHEFVGESDSSMVLDRASQANPRDRFRVMSKQPGQDDARGLPYSFKA